MGLKKHPLRRFSYTELEEKLSEFLTTVTGETVIVDIKEMVHSHPPETGSSYRSTRIDLNVRAVNDLDWESEQEVDEGLTHSETREAAPERPM